MSNGNTKRAPDIPLVSAAFTFPFIQVMERNNIDTQTYLDRFHLLNPDNIDPYDLVPEKPFWQLVNQVAIEEMIPDFGMQVARSQPWHMARALQESIQHCSSLRELIETFGQFATAHSTTTEFKLRIEEHSSWFEYHGQPLIKNDIQMELYRVTGMIDLVRFATSSHWSPSMVDLMMLPNKIAGGNQSLKEVELRFEQARTAIEIPTQLLDASFSLLSPGEAKRPIDLKSIAEKKDLANAIRKVINLYLTDRNLSIELVAELAGVSTRVLQLALKEKDLSYNEILTEARSAYAMKKLGNKDIKVSDVARQLGYTDPAHFTRAFQRWTGLTPSKYRETTTPDTD
jgi:AraC-like DNA-binding protein